jgi:acetyl esterase/lipase
LSESEPTAGMFIDPELAPTCALPSNDWAALDRESLSGFRDARAATPPPAPVGVRRSEMRVGRHDVRVRLHTPARETAERRGCIVWIHGGGHVLGGFDTGIPLLDQWCLAFGCTIVAPAYSLSPERPFPAALDECLDVVQWLGENVVALGLDPKRIVLAGVSAGGGLAAALTLRLRQFDKPPIVFRAQYLQYPMLDDRMVTASSRWAHAPIWPPAANRFGWASYLRDVQGPVSELAAPGRAVDVANLPPAMIVIGTADIFLDEGLNYARALIEAGVPTDLRVYAGAPHGFMTMAPRSRVSSTAIEDVSRWLRARLEATAGAAGTLLPRAS